MVRLPNRENGITPLVWKTQAVEILKTPKSRKQLKSIMGSMHSLHKNLPKLAEVSAALRPLLSQKNEIGWTPDCENAFQKLKLLVKNITELKHYDIHWETRIVCDADHDSHGAVLEQYGSNGWHHVFFAACYLNPAENKYSTNELDLLAVVWATKNFRNFLRTFFQSYIRSQSVTYINKFIT